MDLNDPSRFHYRKPTSTTERFLGVASHAPLVQNPSSSSTADELNEDDVVFFSWDYTESNLPSSTPSSSSSPSTPSQHYHHHLPRSQHHNRNHNKGFGFGPPDVFGILAALPENDEPPNFGNGSHFFYKASVSLASSSSSSSSSRLIPAIPKPLADRISSSSSSSSVKFHQSAPVNVPILSPAMMKARRRHCEFDEDHGDEDAEDEEMLPPHEIVARNSAHSPMLACSVLEGVGRTLKGRDLRQVRNAVWRQTGFLD